MGGGGPKPMTAGLAPPRVNVAQNLGNN